MIGALMDAVTERLQPWRVITDRQALSDVTWPAPWVVLDFPPPRLVHDRWEASNHGRQTGTFQTSSVGTTPRQAGELHDRVVERLLDWVPVVEGWPTVWPITTDTEPRLMEDSASLPDRTLVQVVQVWTWQAERNR